MQDFSTVFAHVPFQHIVVDEAHRLKNQNAKILLQLKKMICTRVLLLTGTPIQNNTEELWSTFYNTSITELYRARRFPFSHSFQK